MARRTDLVDRHSASPTVVLPHRTQLGPATQAGPWRYPRQIDLLFAVKFPVAITLLTRRKRLSLCPPSVRIDVRSDHSRHPRAKRLGSEVQDASASVVLGVTFVPSELRGCVLETTMLPATEI